MNNIHNNIDNYIKKYNNLENILNLTNAESILSELKNDLLTIHQSKSLVNKSKSLMIKINKFKNILNNKKNLEKYINEQINNLDSNNTDVLNIIIKNYKHYLNIDYDQLNDKIETIIQNSTYFNQLDFFYMINHKKEKKNNLQKLITSINFKNCYLFYPKIYFLENIEELSNQDTIVDFIQKFNFNYDSMPHKLLKRGFLFEVNQNNSNYILKFQPNKSFIEILINKYLSKYEYLNEFILYPKYFFVNKNNSYFYIIEKYDCDLFTYLKNIKKPISSYNVLSIIKFLIKFIYYLHKLNIIYSDIKLENIVLNHDQDNNIKDMKFIDFDVSLFDVVPNEFMNFDPKIIQLLNNKKPRGTKFYQSSNEKMEKSNDIYSIGVFIIILLYKNIMKLLNNHDNLSSKLKSKINKRLIFYKNKLEKDEYKIKLMKYMFRIYNDKRFNQYWNVNIKMKDLYLNVKKCINQSIDIQELYTLFN